ncbi:MAG: hypothetical protein ACK5ZG_10515 [Phycisphaerae bacterium]|jgi:hypothetical protein
MPFIFLIFAVVIGWALLTLRDGLIGRLEGVTGPTRCGGCGYELAGLVGTDEPVDGGKVCPECGVQLQESTVLRASQSQRVFASRRRTTMAFAVIAAIAGLIAGGWLSSKGAYTQWFGGSAVQPLTENGPTIRWTWTTQSAWTGTWERFARSRTYRSMTARIALTDGREMKLVMPRSYIRDKRGWLRAELVDADGTVTRVADKPTVDDLQRWTGRNVGLMAGMRDAPAVDALRRGLNNLVMHNDPLHDENSVGTTLPHGGSKTEWDFVLPWGLGAPLILAAVLTWIFDWACRRRDRLQTARAMAVASRAGG